MKRILFLVVLAVLLANAAFADSCKIIKAGWSITADASKPQLKDLAVKGVIVNQGKVLLTTVIVSYEIVRKSDNKVVTESKSTIDNMAPNAQVTFTTRPPVIIEPQTNVNNLFYFRLRSVVERTSEN